MEDEKFRDVTDLWDKLKENRITFYFLPIKDMGLTDELYIKMNARGRQLSIYENIKAYTLFSTHYHELTRLEKRYKNIKNVHVSAVENNDTLTFLHKVKAGAVDKSYGIHVARLAKMPNKLLDRASEILNDFESNAKRKNPIEKVQLSMDFFPIEEKDDIIKKKIESIDLMNTTPINALNLLYEIQEEIKKGD